MAKAVNVILDVNNREYDLNTMGLVNMTFDRYLGEPSVATSGVLSNLDVTMFDYTGYNILSILQAERGNIRIRYGFDDNLSDVYVLNSLKYKATYNNMGVMIAIGAYATQTNRTFPAEVFFPGTLVRDILVEFSKRNGWYIGNEGSNDYISVGDLRIIEALYKPKDQTDIEFIKNSLLPQCNRIIVIGNDFNVTEIWDVRLVMNGRRPEFFFRENNVRKIQRRIFNYSYGEDTNSSIISLTNSVDMSFLINGLTLEIPMTAGDYLVTDEQLEEKEEEVRTIVGNEITYIENLITKYGLHYMNPRDFEWKINLISAENARTSDPEMLRLMILDKIHQAMNAINSIDMQVIGNPSIMPTDLVSLTIKNRDGGLNILSSNSAVGGYWRVVGIREEVGLGGYSTTLKLVRELTTASGSGGSTPSITTPTVIEELT